MYYKTTPLAGIATVEILASDDYQAVPLKIDETETVKAGMPITQAGKKAPTGENAIGILLYDVDPTRNPNGAVVVDGIVDWGKCKAHSEATANAADIAKILPKITFREDGKTYAGGGSGSGEEPERPQRCEPHRTQGGRHPHLSGH